MADESKKIILQLQIDQAKSLGDIVNLKDRIAKLKEEQKALNTTTKEGKAAYEAYNAQIKALTKEQKSLELAVEKTAAGFEFEAGSIAANRAELSKLTAEYKNLANPTAEQTKRIKALSDRLKEQEAAIGNTSRNVGNYKEALTGIQAQLGSFGPQVQQLTAAFNGTTQGLKLATQGFGTLKGAIATTGIGVLLLALASLLQYFKQTDEGATKLEGAMGALGAIFNDVAGLVAEFGGRIIDVVSGAESFQSALSDLGDFILNNFTNRLKSILVLGESIGKLFKGDFSGSAKTALDAVIQFQTGIEGGTDKAQAYAEQLAKVAQEAFDYAVQLDAINDAQRELNVTTAKSDQIVQQLIISSKNRTKSDQERIEIIERANKIEEENVTKQLSLDRQRLALLAQRNQRERDAINQKLQRDIEDAKSEEKKAQLRQRALSIADKLEQEYADLEEKIIKSETSFILLREKNQNRIDVLNEQIAADRQRAYDEYVKQLETINKLELDLETQRRARSIANLNYELQNTELTTEQRTALLAIRAQEEIDLEKRITDEKLAELTKRSLEEGANQQAIELEKQAILEQSNQKLLEITRTTEDQITAIQSAAEKKRLEESRKAEEERKKIITNTATFLNGVVNQSVSILSDLNKTQTENAIQQLEFRRKAELRAAGNDKKKIEEINKRFDDLQAKRNREAAQKDLELKQVQAIANTATGFTQALAQGGVAGILTGALVLAAGAVQIESIESQKSKLAKGGLLVGPSHNEGGITGTGRFGNIEVEGGEYVMSRKAVREIGVRNLDALNGIGNRPPVQRGKMARGGQIFDGGFAARRSNDAALTDIQVRNIVQDTISNMPSPVVLVDDITRGVNNKVKVVNRANVTK